MANWSTLKAAIADVIKTNGNQKITGAVLQNTLNSIVNAIGENATYAGIAIPSTNPGAPDGPIFYFANDTGVYSNFDGIELESPGLAILYNNTNGTWKSLKVYECLQELGISTTSPISQYAASAAANPAFYTNSGKINPFIKEIYISGAYDGTPASELGLYITRAGCAIYEDGDRSVIFIYFADKEGNNVLFYQTASGKDEKESAYHKKTQNGLTLEFISRLPESPYNWNSSSDDIEASTLTDRAFNIDFSPAIKAIHNAENITELDRAQKQFQFVIDNGVNKVATFIKELYISSDEISLTNVTFTISRLFKYTSAMNKHICCGLSIKSSLNENNWYFEIPEARNSGGEYTGLVGSGYYCFTTSNGINFELVIDWENNQYNYNDTLDSEVITRYAYNIDYSPTIKQRHYAINEVARHYDNDNNDFTLIDGWLRQNGNLEDVNNSTQYVITDYIPLKSIYDIEFRCAYQWNLSYCCLYDIDKKFLKSYVPLGNVANLTYIEGKMSELSNVPANAAYAILCTITNGNNGVEGAYINSSKIIKDNLNVLKSKKGYFIGDSIMIGHDDVETTLSITHFLTEKYGMNCVNKAKGGAVLTSSTKHYAPIYQMLTSIPDDADYIIMQGGANGMAKEASKDAPWGWGSMSDSYETEFDTILQIPCLEAMCKYVITHFPTKKYGFIITYKISNWYDYWDEKSELIKQVLEKWGIPYLDWRQCGITLASQAVREQYGVDAFASYPEYSSSNTYSTDDRVIYQGQAYKANQDISIPEEWNSAHWDLVSETRYDGWHCNAKAYQQLADKTAAWMKSL